MRRKRELGPDEIGLWSAVAETVTPLHPKRAVLAKPASVSPSQHTPAGLGETHRGAGQRRTEQASPAPRRHQSAFVAGDPKRDRQAARGRLEIDARLDLHGLFEREAEATLTRFVRVSAQSGARCVLVITGKGERSAGRGVLRRRFFDWIEKPDVRALIARAAQAHPRHGGAGAFYLFLKSGGGARA